MADSPTRDANGPLGLRLKLNGALLDDAVEVISVHVEARLDEIPKAVIVLADGSIPESDFPMLDSRESVPGTEVEIAAFYGAHRPQVVFSGIVTGFRLRLKEGSGPQLELTCRDRAIRMGGIGRRAHFAEMRDTEAMAAVIAAAGLSADIAATPGPVSDIVQYDCTDWDFLRLLAGRNGLVLSVAAGHVRAAGPDPAAATRLTLTTGIDILEFDASLDAAPMEKADAVSGWDPAAQQVVTETREVKGPAGWGNLQVGRLSEATGGRTRGATVPFARGQAALAGLAQARADRAALAAIRGRCTYIGSAAAGPGDSVELAGLGSRFSGTAYVAGVVHRIEAGTWTTTAELGLPRVGPDEADGLSQAAGGGIAAPLHGLHVGTVLALTGGEAGAFGDETMIRVRLPLFGEGPAEIWARHAAPYASKGSGLLFLPEIGDEVIVGFLSGDPGAPVVLGALHGAAHPRPAAAGDRNGQKMLATRSGLALAFDDDRKVLSVVTPGGQRIDLNDAQKSLTLTDMAGNVITMGERGVTIDSKGMLELTAAGPVSITSGADVSLGGANVTLEGTTGVTARGGAQAELSAGGETIVKGAMVMIN